jgi:sugar lactone lactonase YvrE
MPFAMDRRRFLSVTAALTFAAPAAALADTAISAIDLDLAYPEGLLIVGHDAYVADISRQQIIVYDTATFKRRRVIQLNACGATSIAPFATDQLLVTCHMEGALAVMTRDGDRKTTVTRTINDRPIPWPNDSTSDGMGGAFVTSSGLFDPAAPATGAVLHVTAAGQAKIMAERFHYANGITYDPASRELFVTEHFAGKVWRFLLDEVFAIRERRVFFDLANLPPPNVPAFWGMGPDNLHLRADGDLIVPHYGGGRFLIVSREGKLKDIVDVPCQFITDAEELDSDILFTGAFSLDSQQPRGVLGRARMS